MSGLILLDCGHRADYSTGGDCPVCAAPEAAAPATFRAPEPARAPGAAPIAPAAPADASAAVVVEAAAEKVKKTRKAICVCGHPYAVHDNNSGGECSIDLSPIEGQEVCPCEKYAPKSRAKKPAPARCTSNTTDAPCASPACPVCAPPAQVVASVEAEAEAAKARVAEKRAARAKATDGVNPRWLACERVMGRRPKAHEFIVWNDARWAEWSALTGRGRPFSAEDHNDFDAWLLTYTAPASAPGDSQDSSRSCEPGGASAARCEPDELAGSSTAPVPPPSLAEAGHAPAGATLIAERPRRCDSCCLLHLPGTACAQQELPTGRARLRSSGAMWREPAPPFCPVHTIQDEPRGRCEACLALNPENTSTPAAVSDATSAGPTPVPPAAAGAGTITIAEDVHLALLAREASAAQRLDGWDAVDCEQCGSGTGLTGMCLSCGWIFRPRWLAWRRRSIGSSEIAAVCNLDPRRDAMDVYASKTGLIDDDVDNAATRRGHRLEPVVADWYADEVELQVRRVEGRAHPLFPWASASPDRERSDGRLVEVKTVVGHKRHEWGEPGSDEVPLAYLAQVQWQLFVFDRRVCDVAALIDLDLRIYTVYRDNDIVETLRSSAETFWREHVERRRAPEPSESDGTRAYLAARYPRSGDGCLPATPGVRDLVKKYEAAHQDVKSATARKDFIRNLLVDEIGDAKGFALDDGESVTNATNRTGKRAFRLSTIARKDDE